MTDAFIEKLLGKYETVPISQIDIDSNQHREMDPAHIEKLARSISERGLINPVTLYRPPQHPRYLIVAGRHRFNAMKLLKQSFISARVYDYELSDYELRAIELYENIHRKDLTQVQRKQQIAHLHSVMQSIAGVSTTGAGAHGHRIKDTAYIAGVSVGTVAGALKLEKAIKDLPELGLDKIESEAEALRILKRFATVVSNQHITSTTTMEQHKLANNYVLGDFFENTLDDGTFALIECDPPYAIDLPNSKKDSSITIVDYTEIARVDYSDFLYKLCRECWRLASPNSWFILWFGLEHYALCSAALHAAGFVHHPNPAIWKKGGSTGQTHTPDSSLGNAYETFFWARKGSPKLHLPGRSNIFDYPVVPPQQKIHPTERPVILITDILRTFAWPGMAILSPFLGSGNTLLAAKELGMPCVGFDLSVNYRNAFIARSGKSV